MLRKIGVILFLLGLLARADQQYFVDGNTFRHKTLGISFRVPSGWGPDQVVVQDEGAIFKLVAPTGRTTIAVLICPHRQSGSDGPEESESKTLEQLEKEVATTIRGFRLTRLGSRKVNNHLVALLSASASGGHRLHRIAVIPDGPKICILWMQSNKETFDSYAPNFEGVLDSFNWEAPVPTQGEEK
ncbi:hypothetical protein JST97_17170 [bacterium]|nr:hypothetical protein [bacterium]